MKKLWLLLFIIVILSLLSAPYAFFAYLCYLGLCGGAPAHLIAQHYTAFYGYFMWVYPLITLFALLLSLRFKKTSPRLAIAFLLIPMICFLPLLYVEWQANQITTHYQQEKWKQNTAKPDDYECAPGKFIRINYNQRYYFYDHDVAGKYGSITGYDSLDALQADLNKHSINLDDCKNQLGENLSDS